MVGCGRAGVAEICDISRANLSDGATAEALHGLSSLGTGGKHASNQERDLHRWMKGSYSMTLETIEISMLLNVPWPMVEKGVFTHGSKKSCYIINFPRSCGYVQPPKHSTFKLFRTNMTKSKMSKHHAN